VFVLEEFEEYFGADAARAAEKHIILTTELFGAPKALMTLADLPW